jgi:hypothetical protein
MAKVEVHISEECWGCTGFPERVRRFTTGWKQNSLSWDYIIEEVLDPEMDCRTCGRMAGETARFKNGTMRARLAAGPHARYNNEHHEEI